MHTTYTARYLNARHHQTGTQVTDKDGHTWTRINTTHATYWDSDGSRCYNLPKTYEPYTYTKTTWKEAFSDALAKHVDAYLQAEKLHGQGITNPQPPQSRGLFQTIPSTWTKPTNLLPKTNWEEIYKNWEDIYNHYKNLGQANPQPLTKNIHIPHATPKTKGMTTTHTTTDETTSAPYIIAIEGIDGAGKNTTTKQLAKLLNATTITFPQYGKTQAAHQITQHLKNPTLNPWHAAQLFAQDRAQTPLPTTGTIIIDRYTASNAAYLKAKTGDPHALQAIEDLEFNTLKLPKPHLHILIDTPVDTAMERVKRRATTNGTQPDTNETDRELQHKVRETYLHMAETNWTSPWLIITPQTTKD
ncbi:thymidylate kinase [Corynebacterium phage PSonyx]|nr:thymidylate kinase [Corynebacterium phage PSonyx]